MFGRKKAEDKVPEATVTVLVDTRTVALIQEKRNDGTWVFRIIQAVFDKDGNQMPALPPHEVIGLLEYAKAMMLSEMHRSLSKAEREAPPQPGQPKETLH